MSTKEREIKIKWRGEEPDVEHLTGTEAKALCVTLLRNSRQLAAAAQEAERQRGIIVNILVSIAHRDAARGIVGPDGKPVMPITMRLPKETRELWREPWLYRIDPREDGSIDIIIDRAAPKPEIVS